MKTHLLITGFLLLPILFFGQVLVNDHFEDDALGALPAGYVISYNGTGTANQKVVDNPVKNGSHAFQLEGRSGWSSEINKPVTFPDLVTTETWLNVTLAADGISAGFGIGDMNTGTWGTRVSRLEFMNNGRIYMTYYAGSSGPRYLLSVPYQANQWYHVKIEHNLTTKKAKVYIDGEQVTGSLNGLGYYEFDLQSSITPTQLILMAVNAGNTRAIFDDVKVYPTDGLATFESTKGQIAIYLTENQEELFVKNMENPFAYKVYDATGKLIKKGELVQNSIPISHLKPGVYILTGTDKYGKEFSKKFLKRK